MSTQVKFSDWIRQFRLEKGWTQRKLADALGISAGYYSSIETGRKTPNQKKLEDMFAKLGVHMPAVMFASSVELENTSDIASSQEEIQNTSDNLTEEIRMRKAKLTNAHIYEWLKQCLQEKSKEMMLHTYETDKMTIDKIFSAMEAFTMLPDFIGEIDIPFLEPVITKNEQVSEKGTLSEDVASKDDGITDEHVGVLKRRLVGGDIIFQNKDSVFIPEQHIRNLGLDEGDFVRAEIIRYTWDNKPVCNYELYQKLEEPIETNRVELDHVLVEKNSLNKLCVRRFYDGTSIVIDDVPQEFILSESDISRLDIKPDDSITIAFSANDPLTVRASWRHNMYEMPLIKEERVGSRKKSNKNEKEQTNDDFYAEGMEVLSGKSILLVDDSRYDYSRNFESLGAEVNVVTGHENQEAIIASIKKADVVLVNVSRISHKAMFLVKKTCKQHDKPCAYCEQSGVLTFVTSAIEQLKKTS